MNIIIIDKKDSIIKTQNKTVIINGQKVPFHLVDTLIIIGKNTLLSSDIIKITNEDINILLVSYNYTQSSIISSTKGKSAELKLSQYHVATTSPLPIAKELLKRKISMHSLHLKKHEIIIDETPLITKIQNIDSLNTLLGIEGSFSKQYFEHYFALFPKNLHKGKRSKRPPLDPVNALLSLYYTLFYNLIAIKLISFGFEPSIGFLHKPFRNHLALSSDILEVLRADINEVVYEMFIQKLILQSDFTKKGGVYLKYEGRKKLWNHFRKFYTSLEPKINTTITDIRSML